MNDTELATLWAVLEPGGRRRARIETRLLGWLEATETSLAREWLGLLKVEPLTGLTYAAVGTVALLLFSPVGWLLAIAFAL
jgi:hypothetical protein